MIVAVGQLIKTIRQAAKKTQRELGTATKISSTRISNIESGALKATPDEISAIANYFESLEIIRAYWVDSPMHETTTKICNRMGIATNDDIELSVKQFGQDIVDRGLRFMQLCDPLPDDEAARHENILLIGQEALAIGNLATALRLLISDIKG